MTLWVELYVRDRVANSIFSRKLGSGLVISDASLDSDGDLDEQTRLPFCWVGFRYCLTPLSHTFMWFRYRIFILF